MNKYRYELYGAAVAIGSLLLVSVIACGADPSPNPVVNTPPAPYAEIYNKFRDKVAHGLEAKLYVGVRPDLKTASPDDCWIPSGSYGLQDGTYKCFCDSGRAKLVPEQTPAAGPPTGSPTPVAAGVAHTEIARPFVQAPVPAGDSMPVTTAPTVAGYRPNGPAPSAVGGTPIPVLRAVLRGGTSGCST